MTIQPAENLTYQDRLLERVGRPHFIEAPTVYRPNDTLIEAANAGEIITEEEAFEGYFARMEAEDPEYMKQLHRIVETREKRYPEATNDRSDRRLQFIVPAYREGENMPTFLQALKTQFENSDELNWGVTFVIDHAFPYRNAYERTAKCKMEEEISLFIKENPQYAPHLDTVFFTRKKNTETPVLPIGLARKVGSDVLMYERMKATQQNQDGTQERPLYLGLMDMDTNPTTPDLASEMVGLLPKDTQEKAKIVRVKGSFLPEDVKANLCIHPMQMMWEGTTSEVGKNAWHTPFNIGRGSAIPARELAMTGGVFAGKLEFPDEDIRQGAQIKSRIHGIETVEPVGRYATSSRREVNTVQGVIQLLEENNQEFDLQTMQCGALIRMYGDWSNNTYRKELGNVEENGGVHTDPLEDKERFKEAVPPALIQAMANAFYRFTASSMYSVDALSGSPNAPEVTALHQQFLKGEIPYFRLQINTLNTIRSIYLNDRARFEELKPLLAQADSKARESISQVLGSYGIDFTIDSDEPIYGFIEDNLPDDIADTSDNKTKDTVPLRQVFRVADDQPNYMKSIARELNINPVDEL